MQMINVILQQSVAERGIEAPTKLSDIDYNNLTYFYNVFLRYKGFRLKTCVNVLQMKTLLFTAKK